MKLQSNTKQLLISVCNITNQDNVITMDLVKYVALQQQPQNIGISQCMHKYVITSKQLEKQHAILFAVHFIFQAK